MEQPREAFVDHLERRHPAARDMQVVYEVVVAHLAGDSRGLRAHRTHVDAVDERVNFVLIEDLFGAFGGHNGNPLGSYCITKVVKSTVSTLSGLPSLALRTLRPASRASARSFSLPSLVARSLAFWLLNSISRSLRMMGSEALSASTVFGSCVMICAVICRKRTCWSPWKLATKGGSRGTYSGGPEGGAGAVAAVVLGPLCASISHAPVPPHASSTAPAMPIRSQGFLRAGAAVTGAAAAAAAAGADGDAAIV